MQRAKGTDRIRGVYQLWINNKSTNTQIQWRRRIAENSSKLSNLPYFTTKLPRSPIIKSYFLPIFVLLSRASSSWRKLRLCWTSHIGLQKMKFGFLQAAYSNRVYNVLQPFPGPKPYRHTCDIWIQTYFEMHWCAECLKGNNYMSGRDNGSMDAFSG